MISLFEKLIEPMSGFKVGDIDIGDQVLDNEYKIKLIFKILEFILNHNNNLTKPTQADIENFKKEIEKELQEKYPNSGIEIK